jgi:hypothetical protein
MGLSAGTLPQEVARGRVRKAQERVFRSGGRTKNKRILGPASGHRPRVVCCHGLAAWGVPNAPILLAHHRSHCGGRRSINDGASSRTGDPDAGVSGHEDHHNKARADLHGHHRQLHEKHGPRLRLSWLNGRQDSRHERRYRHVRRCPG